MFDLNDAVGASGITVQLIINGENATQQFEQFASSMQEKLAEFQKQVKQVNDLLTRAFSPKKVNEFADAVKALEERVASLNKTLQDTPDEKLAALTGAAPTRETRSVSGKRASAYASQLAGNNKQLIDGYTKSFSDTFFSSINKGFTTHTLEGTKSLIKTFGTIASWIGRIRVLAQSAVKMIFNLIKSPFTLVSNLLQKVSNAMGAVFKAFEWVQYQFFMQFMNIWLFSKTLLPVIQTFIDYNKEIYQTWAIIRGEWGVAFDTLKAELRTVELSAVTDNVTELGKVLDDVLGKDRETTLVKFLSDLGVTIAMTYGKMPQDVASAFYQLASATVSFNDIANATIQATKASVAGATDLTTAITAGIQASYAFGTELSNLNKIYDLQFQTVKYGIIRYEELAQVMGRVYQPAASLSESFENMQEMYATMAFATRVGLSPEMAAFGLARLYEAFSDARVVSNLKDINVEVYDAIGNFRGLHNIVQDLVVVVKGYSTSVSQTILSNLGFDMRARRVLRSLINNFSAYTQIMTNFGTNVEDAMNSAFDTMTESFSYKIDQFKATWETLKITISESSIDTLNYFLENISYVLKAIIGWLKEGVVYIGNFSASIGSLVKYAAVFYGTFAAVASLAGIIKVALTPAGLVISSFLLLLRDAMKGGKAIQYLSQRFEGLAGVLSIIGDYIKLFLGLLRSADTPIKAFAQLINMMLSDLNTLLFGESGISSLKGIIDSFKALFTGIKGIFDPASYIKAMQDFTKETEVLTDKIGTVIAYRFGKVFNSIGEAVKEFIITAFDITEGSSGTVLGAVISRTYRFIMDVFAGIFGKSPDGFGLLNVFGSIFESVGVVIRDKFGTAILNPAFIRDLGSAFSTLLGQAIKAYFTNFGLVLTITGFNIAKELTYGLFAKLSAMQTSFLQSQTKGGMMLSMLGDTLKYRAILEFIDVLLPPDFAEKLKGPAWEISKWLLSAVMGVVSTGIRMMLMAKGTGDAVAKALERSLKAGLVTIYATTVNIFTGSMNDIGGMSSKFDPVSKTVAKGLSKHFLLSMIVPIAIAAGGALFSMFGDKKDSPVASLTSQVEMQAITNKALGESVKSVVASTEKANSNVGKVLAAVGLTAGAAVAIGLSAGAATPLVAAIGTKLVTMFAALKAAVLVPAGVSSIKTLISLMAGSITAVGAAAFMGDRAKEGVSYIDSPEYMRSLNKDIQTEYINKVISGLPLTVPMQSIAKQITPNLLSEKEGLLIPDMLNYADKIKKAYPSFTSENVRANFAIQALRELEYLSEELGLTVNIIDDMATVYKEDLYALDMSVAEFMSLVSSFKFPEIPGRSTGRVLKKYGILMEYGILMAKQTEQVKSMSLGQFFESYSSLLDVVYNQIKIYDIGKLEYYTARLNAMDRFYGSEAVLKQFTGIEITEDTDLEAVFDTISTNLEKLTLSTPKRMEFLSKANKLYVTYFSNVVSSLEDAGTQVNEALKQDTAIRGAIIAANADKIAQLEKTVEYSEAVSTVLSSITISEIFDTVKKMAVSADIGERALGREALEKVVNTLAYYSKDIIPIEDYLEFFKLILNLKNYIEFEEGKMLEDVYNLKNLLLEFAMPTQTSIDEITALSAYIDGLGKTVGEDSARLNETIYNTSWWKKTLEEKAGSTVKLYASKIIAEAVATFVVQSILDATKDQDYIKRVGLGKVYSADTGMLLEGTKYATSFKDPYEVFAEYLTRQLNTIFAGTSPLDLTREQLEAKLIAFIENSFPTGTDTTVIGNFNEAISELILEQAGSGINADDLISNLTDLSKLYFSDDMKKFVEQFGKIFSEFSILEKSKEYTEAFSLLFDASIEEVIAAVSGMPDVANRLLEVVKEVQDAINTARRGLSATTTVLDLALSGVDYLESYKEFSSEYKFFSTFFGGLFGRQPLQATLLKDLNTGLLYGIKQLQSSVGSYDFSQDVDLQEFIGANANLLIQLGVMTQEEYLHIVATGLWPAEDTGDNITGTVKTYREKLVDLVSNDLYTLLKSYVLFTERQLYYMYEVSSVLDKSILKSGLTGVAIKMRDVFSNLSYWFNNEFLGWLNPVNWASIIASDVPLEAIIKSFADATSDNIINLTKSSVDYQNILFKSVFKEIRNMRVQNRFRDVEQDMYASLTPSGRAKVMGTSKAEPTEEQQKAIDAYVDKSVKALMAVQSVVQDEIISNLQGISKGLIAKYVPGSVKILDTVLNLPLLGGGLNILADIASTFIGNYLFDMIAKFNVGVLKSTIEGLEKVNKDIKGEPLFADSEIIDIAENLLVDGYRFLGSLLTLPLKMLTSGLTFEDYIGSLNIESMLGNTIKYLQTLSKEDTKDIGNWVVSGVKNIKELAPVMDLLTQYRALDDKTETAVKDLVGQQWESLKTFVGDLLGIKKWILDLVSVGFIRSGLIDLTVKALPKLDELIEPAPSSVDAERMVKATSSDIDNTLGLRVSTEPGGAPDILKEYYATLNVAVLDALLYRLDNMLAIQTNIIAEEVKDYMSYQFAATIPKDMLQSYLSQITSTTITNMLTRIDAFLTDTIIAMGNTKLSGLTIYNMAAAGLLGEPLKLTDLITDAQNFDEAREKIIAELRKRAVDVDPAFYKEYEAFSNMFLTSALPLLSPAEIKRLFPATPIPEEYLNLKGTAWVSKDKQAEFMFGRLTPEQHQKLNEYYTKQMMAFYDNISLIGETFNSIGNSLDKLSEELSMDFSVFSKGLKTLSAALTGVAGMKAGWTALDKARTDYNTAQAAGNVDASITAVLGMVGGVGQIVASILSAGLIIWDLWKESEKITEQQLVAVRQNTVALQSLTNILDTMRATMYGAPSGFSYGYVNPAPAPTPIDPMYIPVGGGGFSVVINVSGVSGDADEIATAVEDRFVQAYKRLR